MTDLPTLAASLTRAQRGAVLAMPDYWLAGPEMDDEVIAELQGLRDASLIERRFGDFGEQRKTSSARGLQVRLSASWWFRLTIDGLELRAFLEGEVR